MTLDVDPFTTVFRKGSRTYFYSSMFFPPALRRDVSVLYSFVRVADNFVDCVPQNRPSFYEFKEEYRQRLVNYEKKKENSISHPVVDEFIALMHDRGIHPAWVDAFFTSMELDITCSTYTTIEDVIYYMYGSAEVVGLMMARILNLPEASFPYAKLLGRSMQYINFIRDISEDSELGRTYIPRAILDKFELSSLKEAEARRKPAQFKALIVSEVERYLSWKKEAENGYHFIPRRFLIPIKTASDMYAWTAQQLAKDPFVLFSRKVKPTIGRIMAKGSSNAAYVLLNVPG